MMQNFTPKNAGKNPSRWDLADSRWDLAERLERLAANAYVPIAPGSNPGIYRHSGIRGEADEAMLNTVNKIKKTQKTC